MRKLKETLVTVQQLDKNMSNLRTWLSRIEAELAKPVVYNVCHSDEIQRKLAEQQVSRRCLDVRRDVRQEVCTMGRHRHRQIKLWIRAWTCLCVPVAPGRAGEQSNEGCKVNSQDEWCLRKLSR